QNRAVPADAKTVAGSKTVMSRTMLPSDANPYGNVHGGEVMKLIDAVAGAAATRHARARVVTARIDQLSFLAPVYVGHLVTAKASVNHVGRTSMEVGVRVEAEDMLTGNVVHVASAYLVYRTLGTAASEQSTTASVDNMKLIRDGKADFAFTLADTAFDAVNGKGSFASPETPADAKVLAVLYSNLTHLVVKESGGINTVTDLKGKRVSMGSAGSGTEIIANRTLEAYGMDP